MSLPPAGAARPSCPHKAVHLSARAARLLELPDRASRQLERVIYGNIIIIEELCKGLRKEYAVTYLGIPLV